MSVSRAETARPTVSWRPAARTAEMLLLFGVLPWLWSGVGLVPWLWEVSPVRAYGIWPPLFVGAAVCLTALLLDPTFDRSTLWNFAGLRRRLRFILALFALAAVVLGTATWFFDRQLSERDLFLAFPRGNPQAWAIVMVFYPFVSVYPQELIFRTFFFHRYGALLEAAGRKIGGDRLARTAVILASAAAFGWAHVIFGTVLAVLLSAVGGFMFAWTYAKTRSTAASCLEHALYGDFLFTIGLGAYFYTGAIGRL